MCGIIGVLGGEPAAPRMIEALKRLEYRGYDSAGVATLEGKALARRRAPGKIKNLEDVLARDPLMGLAGIGHTRWATHGKPTEENAHPHAADGVAIVHNGIIENFRPLRDRLIQEGRRFESETDSEVVAHLIASHRAAGLGAVDAAAAAIAELEGAFAIAVVFADAPDLMVGARRGSPLVVGLGEGETFLGSDAIAVAPFTQRVIYLEEGDLAALSRAGVVIRDASGAIVERPVAIVAGAAAAEKGNHRHFMQKEIYEQPETIARTLSRYVDAFEHTIAPDAFAGIDLQGVSELALIACGTAHYAGRVAEYWIERIALTPAECDIASEFRYRAPALTPGAAGLFISQSGETADTLAALRYAAQQGWPTLAVLNVPHATMWREAQFVLPTLAGPEIGVASTKAFTSQLAALAAFTLALAKAKGVLSDAEERRHIAALLETPRLVAEALQAEAAIAQIAHDHLARAQSALFLGRGAFFPLALEGALKLKEISYIHAEGYAAGELKHGPIALIEDGVPVIVLAPKDALFEKTMSNVEEVAARGGQIILISDAAGHADSAHMSVERIVMPACDPFIAPIVASVPIQLIAYLTAAEKGTDVDQPRNLAKSVTVE